MKTKNTKKEAQLAFQKRNKIFRKASRAEKRVLIAKDVLEQLKQKKIIAENQVWAVLPTAWNNKKNSQICDLTEKKGRENQCQCCALGALMLSEIRNTNDFMARDAKVGYSGNFEITLDDSGKRIRKFFSEKQLELIESAYEMGEGQFDGTNKSIDFGWKFDYSKDRMRAIMKNIVKNGGTFEP